MQEIDAIVAEILAPLEDDGVTVRFRYQEETLKMPAVTYYILTEAEGFRADNREQSRIARVQVDVWAGKRTDMSCASIRANEMMQADGWIRELSRDLPREGENYSYHRTMRFAKELFLEGGEENV